MFSICSIMRTWFTLFFSERLPDNYQYVSIYSPSEIYVTIRPSTICQSLCHNGHFICIIFVYSGGTAYWNTKRLRGYSIRSSNDTALPSSGSSCYRDPGNVTLPTIIEKDCERTARYVWIYQKNTLDGACPMLEICEVQVFGMYTTQKKKNQHNFERNSLEYISLLSFACP